ncbi:hypothetical protein D3C84_598560 [compost metagenome]
MAGDQFIDQRAGFLRVQGQPVVDHIERGLQGLGAGRLMGLHLVDQGLGLFRVMRGGVGDHVAGLGRYRRYIAALDSMVTPAQGLGPSQLQFVAAGFFPGQLRGIRLHLGRAHGTYLTRLAVAFQVGALHAVDAVEQRADAVHDLHRQGWPLGFEATGEGRKGAVLVFTEEAVVAIDGPHIHAHCLLVPVLGGLPIALTLSQYCTV